ncbi:MAG: hypothetical protein R3Y24_06240 [Eubacteriales bacterium]
MREQYIHMGLLIYLGMLSYFDMKEKSIKASYLIIGLMLAFLYRLGIILTGSEAYITGIYGILPGVILLLIGRFTYQSIGYGDGLVIIIIGLLLSNIDMMYVIIYGFLASFIFCGAVVFCKKVSKETTIPFLPFLFLAHILYFGRRLIGI